ncbi:MAG: hypothetical protein F6K41_04275 [Symploca sp. SIO3E6]|nr:hypothetical protein [Caldora sp. SIO3E6]
MGAQIDEPRIFYERAVGKRVSDSHWTAVKKRLTDQGLMVNEDNVLFYAKLKKLIPRATGIQKALEAYNKAEKLLVSPNKISGLEVLGILASQGINPHKGTISRWFSPVGGFRKTRFYLPEKLIPVLTKAFIYKASNTIKLGA